MNNNPQYQVVENRPIGCTFCGAQVQGRVNEKRDAKSDETHKECRWVCGRCGNLVKIGNVG
jgi:hypothetical protein